MFPIYRAICVPTLFLFLFLEDTQDKQLAGSQEIFAEFEKKKYIIRIADPTFNPLTVEVLIECYTFLKINFFPVLPIKTEHAFPQLR